MHDLAALGRSLEREREIFGYPSEPWTKPLEVNGESVLDALIIGAGQAGTATGIKLQREGIGRFLIVDQASEGEEGPWSTWARMHDLRTMKTLHGVDGGFSSASFRSWYEAQHGAEGYEALTRIPKGDWQEYMLWVRRAFDLPVENSTRVTRIAPEPAAEKHVWQVTLTTAEGAVRDVLTRKIVICTGWGGLGGGTIPSIIADVDRRLWAHSSDMFDAESLLGKRVAVLGCGASAFDNAATALEHGATVVQHVRRPELPEVNTLRALEYQGLFRNYGELPDEIRLGVSRRTLNTPMPPPPHSVERCRVHTDTYDLALGTPWIDVAEDAGELVITTPRGEERFDFAILATGFDIELGRVPWLAEVVDDISLWGDRFELDSAPGDRKIAASPYLDGHLRCVSRNPETAGLISGLYMQNGAGYASVGDTAIGNNALHWSSDLVAQGIARDIFLEDAEAHYSDYLSYDSPEFALNVR